MSEGAYARAGVDQGLSGSAVAALVDVLAGIRTGRPSRAVLRSGHYANVLRIDDRRGIALSCDSVGSKVIVCEQLGRYDTIGIDLFGMNANDVICVGADPIDFRLAHLEKTPRLRAALELVRHKSGWGTSLPARCGFAPAPSS